MDDVAEDYDITRNEALLCVVWCGPSPAFTSPDFRARWHRWADNAWHALTHGETVPDPPVEGR